VRVRIAMERFAASVGTVSAVGDAFEATGNKWRELKTAENGYSSEFRLVSVPPDIGRDEECVPVPEAESGNSSHEKYYGTAFREKKGNSPDKVISLLWAQEGKYWKIVAIRVEDSGSAGITPKKVAASSVEEVKVEQISGDPAAVRDITNFYQSWLLQRDVHHATSYVSPRSYSCLGPAAESEKNLSSGVRIAAGLEKAIGKIPPGQNLADIMSKVEPVNELVRTVEQSSSGFSIIAVPEQMVGGFLCENRGLAEKVPELKRENAKYGKYYVSASQLNYGEEQSPALLLLWAEEQDRWKVWAWAVEVP